jgi:hypothetical protein
MAKHWRKIPIIGKRQLTARSAAAKKSRKSAILKIGTMRAKHLASAITAIVATTNQELFRC